MSTNRSNNRRRGRGSNRGPGGGGGQVNRIDSRARGNAPQLLEKYRKLAHDASLNDDRVQTEYYLQFADHYFRVLSDSRAPKDESRQRNDRDESDDDGQDEESGYYDRSQDQRPDGGSRERDRDDRGQVQQARNKREADEDDDWSDHGPRGAARASTNTNTNTNPNANSSANANTNAGDDGEGEEPNNPFLRDSRARTPRARGRRRQSDREDEGGNGGLDPDSLPPAISRGVEGEEIVSGDSDVREGEAPKRAPRAAKPRAPRTRTRAPRASDDGDTGALEAVS